MNLRNFEIPFLKNQIFLCQLSLSRANEFADELQRKNQEESTLLKSRISDLQKELQKFHRHCKVLDFC